MADTVRAALAKVAAEEFTEDWLKNLVREIKESQRSIRGEFVCKQCSKRQIANVEVPDYFKRLQQAIAILEQVEGKPGTLAVEDAGVTMVVERPELRG